MISTPCLITDFNRIRLQLIGHHTLECEDPCTPASGPALATKASLN
ncbi:MAG: cellulose biosynthesis cyclic di-GMP-binding regulatory protein BcsB [Betaproteobacteria bacterium]|nr:cellulose biosynthesis cyclic di-GMP-binding regulatory protein BcsB [Betaproteobacteria bacterium]